MNTFEELSIDFIEQFNKRHFPESPASLYEPGQYFLGLGGKRIRPVLCLMGNQLFETLHQDAFHAAMAIELFHNFTLVHDDIMDKAPLRRGMPTVHEKYGSSTALLAGDVMLVVAYEYLNKIKSPYLHHILHLFNRTAMEVCEGQQLDMDFEKREQVTLEEYLKMIELKTSVLLASSLQIGAIIGGSGESNQRHLYQFGRNLGLAFQVQDDYLDAFGDPAKFGKQVGGDIITNKKTFLLIKAMEVATATQRGQILDLIRSHPTDKVAQMQAIFKSCGVDAWANELKQEYLQTAFRHLDEIAVLSARKEPLSELAAFLVQRDY